jgi:hypothetical protein
VYRNTFAAVSAVLERHRLCDSHTVVLPRSEVRRGELLTRFQLVLTSSAELGTGATREVSVSVTWLRPRVPANENNVFTASYV